MIYVGYESVSDSDLDLSFRDWYTIKERKIEDDGYGRTYEHHEMVLVRVLESSIYAEQIVEEMLNPNTTEEWIIRPSRDPDDLAAGTYELVRASSIVTMVEAAEDGTEVPDSSFETTLDPNTRVISGSIPRIKQLLNVIESP